MQPSPHSTRKPAPGPPAGAFARFLANHRGATAVEFAFVAAPFIFLIFAIFELAVVFLVNVSLENATAVAARALRTGNVIADGITTDPSGAAAFKTSICSNMSWIPTATCQKQLQVDVRSYTSFESQTQPNPISGSTFNQANLCYYSGNSSNNASANTIVLVRAYYLWPLMTPFLIGGLQNVTTLMNGSTTISTGHMTAVQAAEVFKNEPFPSSNPATTTC